MAAPPSAGSFIDTSSVAAAGYDDSGNDPTPNSQNEMQAEVGAAEIQNPASTYPAPATNDIFTAPIYVVLAVPEQSITNGGYNVPGPIRVMPSTWLPGDEEHQHGPGYGKYFDKLAERITDPTESPNPSSGAVFNPPASLPFGPTSPFGTSSGTFQVGDGEAEPGGQAHYGYRFGGPSGTLGQFIYSAKTKAMNGTAGSWVAADGNSETLFLDPVWSSVNSPDPQFTGAYDLTINGDQLANTSDSITLSLDASTGSLLVNLNGQKFNFDANTIQKITVNGKSGDDTLTIDTTNGNPIPLGGVNFHGGAGTNTIAAIGNDDFTLTDSKLFISSFAGSGTVNLTNTSGDTVTVAKLTGGASANDFNVNGWNGTGTLNGVGGNDTVTAEKNKTGTFTLQDSELTTPDGMDMMLNGVGTADLTDDAGGSTFVVDHWSGGGIITGTGNGEKIKATKAGGTFTLGDGELTTATT